ncbi:choice-of-anchor D domain-containing protein, partial [Verrucomicrobiota bacterium]
MKRAFVLSLAMVMGVNLFAAIYSPQEIVQMIATQSLSQVHQSVDINFISNPSNTAIIKAAIWDKYVSMELTNSIRTLEHSNKRIDFDSYSMRYDYSTVGTRPTNGYSLYIALHGGGATSTSVNDSQWEMMKTYYLTDGVTNGIYLAPRGINDTWNLHSRPQSYVMYDRIIENMILFENIDPNRVYILGFSAGGDGTYQICPRMADRWAAGNMSAGHPNGISGKNLYRTPFLLQVGEVDTAYNRHTQAAQFHVALNGLQSNAVDGYVHDCYIHVGMPHNFFDNHQIGQNQQVMLDAAEWLNNGDSTARSVDANAIRWLDQHVRDPKPTRLIWDLNTRAMTRTGIDSGGNDFWRTQSKVHQFYWLDIGTNTSEYPQGSQVIASISNNTIVVEESGDYLKVLVSADMLDANDQICVEIGGTSLWFEVLGNLSGMVSTMIDRGDPNYIFETDIQLAKSSGEWGAIENSWSRRVGEAVAPEVAVSGDGVEIADGDDSPYAGDGTEYGGLMVDQTNDQVFVITNSGSTNLTLTSTPVVAISGAADFTVTSQPATPIVPGGSSAFTVRFMPLTTGVRTAEVFIANDDVDENPYTFAIRGTGLDIPIVANSTPMDVSPSTATLNGILADGVQADVYVYWGTNDGGTDPAQWSNTGLLSSVNQGGFTYPVSGLDMTTTYYYNFCATNAAGSDWATSDSFTTLFEAMSFKVQRG